MIKTLIVLVVIWLIILIIEHIKTTNRTGVYRRCVSPTCRTIKPRNSRTLQEKMKERMKKRRKIPKRRPPGIIQRTERMKRMRRR